MIVIARNEVTKQSHKLFMGSPRTTSYFISEVVVLAMTALLGALFSGCVTREDIRGLQNRIT